MNAYVRFKRLEKEREIGELDMDGGSRIGSIYLFENILFETTEL